MYLTTYIYMQRIRSNTTYVSSSTIVLLPDKQ